MTLPIAFMTGLVHGLLHSTGPDHCAAVVTLISGEGDRRREALRTALRFGAAHALALGTIAAICLLSGLVLSEGFERWAEIAGGVVLMAVAFATLLFPSTVTHGHPSLGAHGTPHVHRRLPVAAGALMALSGVRSLTLALPPLMLGGGMGPSALIYLPGFGLGVLAGMLLFGLLVGEGLRRVDGRWVPSVRKIGAAASAILGAVWIGRCVMNG